MSTWQDLFLGRVNGNELFQADYERFRDADVYGWFLTGKPVLGINNLDLVKNVLVKDFDHFTDRTSAVIQEGLKSGGDLDKVSVYI